MKCKKCGHTSKDINGMRKHYLKAHPGAMKHKGPRKARIPSMGGTLPWKEQEEAYVRYAQTIGKCPYCGAPLRH